MRKITEEINSKSSEELQKSETINAIFQMPETVTLETSFRYRLKLPQTGKDVGFWLNHSEGAEVVSAMEINLKFKDGQFEY
ncbi:MAG: hypothetical protein AAF693_10780 [Bacteroidota bacterium]